MSFIICDMLGFFHTVSVKVVVEDVLGGITVTKKDPLAYIIMESVWTMRAWGKTANTTAKGAKKAEIGDMARTDGVRRLITSTMRGNVVDADEVMKRIGPEFSR